MHLDTKKNYLTPNSPEDMADRSSSFFCQNAAYLEFSVKSVHDLMKTHELTVSGQVNTDQSIWKKNVNPFFEWDRTR